MLLGFVVVVVCRLLLSPAAPLTEPGGRWPATASWTGRIEGQEGTSPFASPSSLKGESLVKKVRRLLQKHESNLENNEHADACMQPHYSPSGGGKVDQGLCRGNRLARQPVVDSFADATIHGWAAGRGLTDRSLLCEPTSGAAARFDGDGNRRQLLHRSEFHRCQSAADDDEPLTPGSPVVVVVAAAADKHEEEEAKESRALRSSAGQNTSGLKPAGMWMAQNALLQ